MDELAKLDAEVHVCITPDGYENIRIETGKEPGSAQYGGNVIFHDSRNFSAPVSSGSFMVDHYIIAPASMGCVGRIASGVSSNLVERCADVAMKGEDGSDYPVQGSSAEKERRDLIILFREAPLNLIHLENLTKLAKAGAVIIPAAPAFYHKPESIDDLISFMIGKIFDILKTDHRLFKRWE
ncbi:MAG: 3-octaprenyl-4-hydroxybenzoate carboxy-lyase [Geovibrio sp.]|nr:3-octaprenyl-4-hydroxybenzoate carboxy-lyase [Geovibrio sp.]